MCQEDLLICILEVRESVTYPQSQLVHSPVRHEIKYISSLCSFHKVPAYTHYIHMKNCFSAAQKPMSINAFLEKKQNKTPNIEFFGQRKCDYASKEESSN